MPSFNKLAKDLLDKKAKKLTPYQEKGLEIADKLQDPQRLSLYIKLARDEKPKYINQALSFAIDYPPSIPDKGAVFLWKFYQLKKGAQKRLFLGLFPENQNEQSKLFKQIDPFLQKPAIKNNFRLVGIKKIHGSVIFYSTFPEEQIPELTTKAENLNKKYKQSTYTLNLKGPTLMFSRILALYCTDPIFYRLIYSAQKWYPQDKKSSKPGKPKPHFTLGRLKNPDKYSEISSLLQSLKPIECPIKCQLRIIESYLTKEGYNYKIVQAIA